MRSCGKSNASRCVWLALCDKGGKSPARDPSFPLFGIHRLPTARRRGSQAARLRRDCVSGEVGVMPTSYLGPCQSRGVPGLVSLSRARARYRETHAVYDGLPVRDDGFRVLIVLHCFYGEERGVPRQTCWGFVFNHKLLALAGACIFYIQLKKPHLKTIVSKCGFLRKM